MGRHPPLLAHTELRRNSTFPSHQLLYHELSADSQSGQSIPQAFFEGVVERPFHVILLMSHRMEDLSFQSGRYHLFRPVISNALQRQR